MLVRRIPDPVWFAMLVVLLWGAGASAQGDLSKALVGKWEGDLQFRGSRAETGRTLVIKSVTERDGKWVADGLYGVTGKGMDKVAIDVDASGKRPAIQFTTDANSVVRLELLEAKSLVGTLTLAGSRKGGADRGLKLEKVE
jgi:hypothetical protein